MQCFNCRRNIPDNARVCQFCEAPVEPEPTQEEFDAARELIAQLPPEALDELHDVFMDSATCEDFVNAIMVGPCPKCGSANTTDCENEPDVEINLAGRCYDCGQYWCCECGKLLGKPVVCSCWDEDDELDPGDWDDADDDLT